MNIKKQAERLETYLEEELKRELPIAILPDGTIGYKNFKIKKSKKGDWILRRINGFNIDKFGLKACALIAAKYYSCNALVAYNEIKLLDDKYQRNAIDSDIFKGLYEKSKDPERKDLYYWRWEITNNRAKLAKEEIVRKFKTVF
jgi:hypothetical protein